MKYVKYTVVLLTTSSCSMDKHSRCVMNVVGPFDTYDQAHEFMKACPPWNMPHIMHLTSTADYAAESTR